MTARGSREASAAAIEAFMARESKDPVRAAADVAAMRVEPADFSFDELMGASTMARDLFADPTVTQIDVDEVRNRVVIGVIDEAGSGRLRAAAAAKLGARASMIEVAIMAPTEVAQSHPASYFRPVPGGVQIEVNSTPSVFCSLGWNAYFRDDELGYNGKRYFITAGHCTGFEGLVTGVTAGQPTKASAIGHEVGDPAFFNNAQNADCPGTFDCRYSDAALFEYAGTASWNHGKIWTRLQFGLNWVWGYRNILGASDMFSTPSLFIGQPISKMGRTTMMTSGSIENVCVAVRQYVSGSPTNKVLLCQAQSSYVAEGGDSGGPVFRLVNPGNPISSHIQLLLGLHWGTAPIHPNIVPKKKTFSDWYLVTAELAATVPSSSGGWLEPVLGVCPGCGY
jgi:hypothetical protein